MRLNSDEHIEAWMTLDALIDELIANADALDESVYDESLVSEYDLPIELVGRRISEVGLSPKIAQPMIDSIADMQERLRKVSPPSADALHSYLLRKLVQRTGRLEEAIARVEKQL